jgi:hypothetical protein
MSDPQDIYHRKFQRTSARRHIEKHTGKRLAGKCLARNTQQMKLYKEYIMDSSYHKALIAANNSVEVLAKAISSSESKGAEGKIWAETANLLAEAIKFLVEANKEADKT